MIWFVVTFRILRLVQLFSCGVRAPEMEFPDRTREVRFRRTDTAGEISPERDFSRREIPVTRPVTGSQEIPRNLHGDSDSTHDSKTFKGSTRWDLNSRRALVSTVGVWEEGDGNAQKQERKSTAKIEDLDVIGNIAKRKSVIVENLARRDATAPA